MVLLRPAILLMMLLAGSACAAEEDLEVSRSHVVEIRAFEYFPTELSVAPGDTIVWVNKDAVPHTVTVAGAWDSGAIGAGESWMWVAERADPIGYYCTFHPGMTGKLTVD